ncbi:MAG TPA: type II secretion system minor pseudopilin GspK [Burkholderiaceae bacterium]|nr:type II secretion system minor pseudopilin GspK [Burkholderiaceae bacterium]
MIGRQQPAALSPAPLPQAGEGRRTLAHPLRMRSAVHIGWGSTRGPAQPPRSLPPALSRPSAGKGPGERARGAALLMALFVAVIATMIVTGLFWRQFVLVRTIDNQQLMSQSRLLLRGSFDWASSLLRENAATNPYDALNQPWAQPLAETRLDQLGESSALASQALMSGGIEDAQSRLNLRNLVGGNGSVDEAQHAVLARLASELALPEPTADLISAYVVRTFSPAMSAAPAGAPVPIASATPALPLVFPEDVARVPGLDPAVGQRLAPYVVVLDARTPVNFNTATAELIAAEINLPLSDARALVADRDRIPFRDTGDILNRLRGRGSPFTTSDVSANSSYFFVRGEIKLQRADTRMEALVRRSGASPVTVMWEREL